MAIVTVAVVKSNKLATLETDLRNTKIKIMKYRSLGYSEMSNELMKERVEEMLLINQIASLKEYR